MFVKVSKCFIFLVKSFLGNFYRHLATFYWSHWHRPNFRSASPFHRNSAHTPLPCSSSSSTTTTTRTATATTAATTTSTTATVATLSSKFFFCWFAFAVEAAATATAVTVAAAAESFRKRKATQRRRTLKIAGKYFLWVAAKLILVTTIVCSKQILASKRRHHDVAIQVCRHLCCPNGEWLFAIKIVHIRTLFCLFKNKWYFNRERTTSGYYLFILDLLK